MSSSLRPARSAMAQPSASSGSQTTTIIHPNDALNTPSATLRLRADPASSESESSARHIAWAEDVIDNEGMGKKSSKVCCIYHKPKEPGDSDSESDSSSSSESDDDSEPDLSRAQRAGGRGRKAGGKNADRKPSPNAYERQPKHKTKRES